MKEQFLQFLETSLQRVQSHKQIAESSEVSKEVISLHDDLIEYINQLKAIVQSTDLAINYITNFQNDINNACSQLPYRNNHTTVQINNKEQIKSNIEKQKDNLSKQIELLKFNLDFFKKLNFFNKNIVAVGANGSGKTTLSKKLKQYLPKSGIVIAAQRIMIIPTFNSISNFNKTQQELTKTQNADKSLKNTFSMNENNWFSAVSMPVHEFGFLLDNLLAERNVKRNEFVNSLPNGQSTNMTITKPFTLLDKTLEIWNSLIEHRTLDCSDGINLTLRATIGNKYPVHQMSDGEKVALYLIAQVLQAPQNGFVITDEPEMFLHKTILRKLWDRLEQERQDCIFVYLTHDLDFATSRNAKKVWIKSYTTPPDNWEIENIPENELPENLLLELLGSRKPILFCESQNGKNDEKIYNVLFPEYTITPVESCKDVINYTKAYNKIPNITTKAFGIIDSDYSPEEQLIKLEAENVYALSVAEVENLLLNEDFLKLTAKEFKVADNNAVDNIKQKIIEEFDKELELQVSNYISAKIDYYFKESNLKKGNSKKDVSDNFTTFTNEINIEDWYNSRKIELQEIIANNNYSKIISVCNHKGLKKFVNESFKISDFTERAIILLQSNREAQEILKNNFHKNIVTLKE